MGIYDRDYYRRGPGRGGTVFGGVRGWTVTTWLIVLNVAVFVLDSLLIVSITDRFGRSLSYPLLTYFGHFSVGTAVFQYQVWRFLTFQFLHANLSHIAFNMIGLFVFGPIIEDMLGRARYLTFYLACGMAGAVGYMLLWGASNATDIELLRDAATPLVGASAGIYGIVMATAWVAPYTTVLVFGLLPARLRDLALFMLAYAAYRILTSGPNAGGEAAHLGGAVLGWLLIRNPHWLNFVNPRRRLRYRK